MAPLCYRHQQIGTVEFTCDLSQRGTEFVHCWEHTVGSCHAPIALRADWQQQLRRCHAELGFRYVRFHGLLSDDVGTVVEHNDELLYSFAKTVFHYRGNVTPPRDYQQWAMLIRTLVGHWVDRYGIREVAQWFFMD